MFVFFCDNGFRFGVRERVAVPFSQPAEIVEAELGGHRAIGDIWLRMRMRPVSEVGETAQVANACDKACCRVI